MGLLINENEFTSKSTSPKLIGETFTTLRTGIIDGAVEQDGSQYNFSDYPEIETLLKNGDLPYINIGNFDEMVSNQGGCDSFGYGTTDELVLYPVYTESAVGGDEIQFYTNVLDWINAQRDSNDVLQGVKLYDKNTYQELVGWYVQYDVIADWYSIYNSEDEVQNSDEGYFPTDSDTVTGVFQSTTYFKVPKKIGRVLVRSQKPTAANDYTWYNLYADGWCEQGGEDSTGSGVKTITLPIKMTNSKYLSIVSTVSEQEAGIKVQQKSTTGFQINKPNSRFEWKVEGYANPTEYTKDKWNYQNVNYERHMIQLK